MRLDEAMVAARRIVEARDSDRIIARLLDALEGALGPAALCLYAHALDAPGNMLALVAHRGLSESATEALRRFPVDERTLAGRSVTAGALTWLDVRAAGDSAWDTAVVGPGVVWALPLLSDATTLGVVEGVSGAPLSQDDREALVGLAGVASAAIARSGRAIDPERMLERANRAIADALRIVPAAHVQAAVQRSFHLWPSPPDQTLPDFLRQVLKVIVREARVIAGAEMAALGIGGTEERPFEPWVFDGASPELEKHVGHPPRPVGTLGLVAHEGQVIRVPEIARHPNFRGLPAGHPPVRSFMGVPVRYGAKSLGNLYLANKIGASEFTEDDQRAVEVLVTYASLALQQTYLRSAVEAHQAHLHSILESAPHGILFIEARSERVVANPRAMQLFGSLDPGGGRESYLRRLRHPDGRPATLEDVPSTHALRGEQPPSSEFVIVQADGKRVPVLESAAPVFGFENRVLGAVVSLEDISAFKDLERMREEFAAMIVHDLRSPIQAILIQAELLSRERIERRELLDGLCRIESNARRLERIASDLLDTARIELHQLCLKPRPVPLTYAVEHAVECVAPTLGPHDVRVSISGPTPDVVLDVTRFDQVLSNLLVNAAKYSSEGAPIDVRVAPAAGGMVVSVEDHGMGMAPEDLEHAFERFYRSRQARAHEVGLGLGLYISKGIVEAHGGRIWAESSPGKGTTLHVWLPLREAPEAEAPEAAPPSVVV